MTGIRHTGRVGATIVPNWRWEDPSLDTYQLRIAGWLASHQGEWCEDYVTRNMIAKRTGISAGKVSSSIDALVKAGIIDVETIEVPQSQGGQRWVITIHLDVWQGTDPGHVVTRARSSGDQGPGHVVTATTGNPVEVQQGGLLHAASQATRMVDADFDEFWRTYGNLAGTGRRKAVECWAVAMKRGDDPRAIIEGLRAWVAYWRTPGAAKAMFAQGFLNQQKWATPPPPIQHDRMTRGERNRQSLAEFVQRHANDDQPTRTPLGLPGGNQ